MKPYPINVNGIIKLIERRLEEDNLSREDRQFLKGFLALFLSLKEQGIETTDSRKIRFNRLMRSLGSAWPETDATT